MIEGHEQAMIVTLSWLKETRIELEYAEKLPEETRMQVTNTSDISRDEWIGVLKTRMARLQSDAHNLGIVGPAAKHSSRGLAIASLNKISETVASE